MSAAQHPSSRSPGLPKISVIVVNWNSKDFVRSCLLSLQRQSLAAELEIIVVDGGSFDGCAEMLANEFPQVIFIQSHKNLGFGQANNLAFERASGEFIWLLNPDTEVAERAGAALLEPLNKRRDAGLTGARLLNSDGTLQTTCVQSLPTPLNQALTTEFLRRRFPSSSLWGVTALMARTGSIEVEAVPGACMMLRREVFAQAGRFDPRYFMYCEDIDLCLKIHRLGLKVLYVPEAEVLHHGGGSSQRQFSKFATVLTRQSIAYYFQNNFGMIHAAGYRLTMALSSIFRLCLLMPACVVVRGRRGAQYAESARKWRTILHWCFGGERWAKAYASDSGAHASQPT